MTVTIFHNPACGTSRNTLAMIRSTGVEPTVIEYLKTGWTRPQLLMLLDQMGVRPRQVLRLKGTRAAELGLDRESASDVDIIEAMILEPALVERPIVQSPKGVALCRPSEKVFDLLDAPPEKFTKEDGEIVTPVR